MEEDNDLTNNSISLILKMILAIAEKSKDKEEIIKTIKQLLENR